MAIRKDQQQNCQICPAAFDDKIKYFKHFKTAHANYKMKCPLCPKEDQDSTKLVSHLEDEHDVTDNLQEISDERYSEAIFRCPFCGEINRGKSNIEDHIRSCKMRKGKWWNNCSFSSDSI